MAENYDCIVIGSGPGGYVAAIRAAQLGMKTAVVEKEFMGGRCLNVACIPAKAVLRVADVYTEMTEAKDMGLNINGDVSVDFGGVSAHRQKVVKTLTGGVRGLMRKNKIDVLEGHGTLTDKHSVVVGDNEYEGKTIILATGSIPRTLLGLDWGPRVLGTETGWALDTLPGSMAIIGAGASGCEMASAYGRLGTDCTLFEALPQILPLEDKEIAKAASRELAKQNMTIVVNANIEGAQAVDDGVELTWGGETHKYDYLVIAAGRSADVDGLGLDAAGVETDDRGQVQVDGAMRTSAEGIYAIGDLVPGPALAHVASDEGIIAVEDAAGMETSPLDYDFIPGATFCHPQVASFGLTEDQARERGYDVTVGKIPIGAAGAATVYGDRSGMLKIVGDKKYGELLGGHIFSAQAANLITELVVARDLEGGYHEVAHMVHPHPTFSEAVMEAARAADGWLVHG